MEGISSENYGPCNHDVFGNEVCSCEMNLRYLSALEKRSGAVQSQESVLSTRKAQRTAANEQHRFAKEAANFSALPIGETKAANWTKPTAIATAAPILPVQSTSDVRNQLFRWDWSDNFSAVLCCSQQSKKPYLLLTRKDPWQKFCLMKSDLQALTQQCDRVSDNFFKEKLGGTVYLFQSPPYNCPPAQLQAYLRVEQMKSDARGIDTTKAAMIGLSLWKENGFILEKKYGAVAGGSLACWRKPIDKMILFEEELATLMSGEFVEALWAKILALVEEGQLKL